MTEKGRRGEEGRPTNEKGQGGRDKPVETRRRPEGATWQWRGITASAFCRTVLVSQEPGCSEVHKPKNGVELNVRLSGGGRSQRQRQVDVGWAFCVAVAAVAAVAHSVG